MSDSPNKVSSFPDDWPEGCPPNEAEPADGMVYRLVKKNPPTADDFLSHHETGRLPSAPPCQRCGLSVFPSKEDAAHQQRLMPKLGEFIASAGLTSAHGVTLATPSSRAPSHQTWWPFASIIKHELFKVEKN